jgi:hypothetical protein
MPWGEKGNSYLYEERKRAFNGAAVTYAGGETKVTTVRNLHYTGSGRRSLC